jgi:hypothetical protein
MSFMFSRATFACPVCAIMSLWSVSALATPETAACVSAFEDSQVLQKAGKLIDAREKATTCNQPACGSLIASECYNILERLENTMPSVVVAVRDEQENDLPQVRVTIDGVPAKPTADGRIVVDPGTYRFHFEANNFLPQDKIVSVRLGEKLRMVSVVMHTPKVESPPGPPATATVTSAAPPPAPPPVSRRTLRIGSGIALGLGLVGFGAFAGLWSTASNQYDTLLACRPNCSPDKVDTVNGNFVASYVALGAGIVGVATSAALFGWSYAVDDRAQVSLVPQVGGARANVLVSF